jgi:hypothetical protein
VVCTATKEVDAGRERATTTTRRRRERALAGTFHYGGSRAPPAHGLCIADSTSSSSLNSRVTDQRSRELLHLHIE